MFRKLLILSVYDYFISSGWKQILFVADRTGLALTLFLIWLNAVLLAFMISCYLSIKLFRLVINNFCYIYSLFELASLICWSTLDSILLSLEGDDILFLIRLWCYLSAKIYLEYYAYCYVLLRRACSWKFLELWFLFKLLLKPILLKFVLSIKTFF